MGHLITPVVPLPLQGGSLGRFIDPFAQFLTDITNLEPILLQLIAFGLLPGGVYALTALGLTMIFGVMNVINFVHGIFFVAGMYSVWLVSGTAGTSPFLGIPITTAVLFAFRVVIHILTIEPVVKAPQQNQLVAVLGVLFTIQSAIKTVFTPDSQQVELLLRSMQVGSVFIPLGQLYALIIALGVVLTVRVPLNRTDLGRGIYGTADNRDGARYVGTSVRRISCLTLGIDTVLAGVAGNSITLFRRFDPFTGETYLINAFIIVILGGLGSFPDAFIGGLAVGMIQVFRGYYPPGTTARMLISLLFIGTLLVRPENLFGGVEA